MRRAQREAPRVRRPTRLGRPGEEKPRFPWALVALLGIFALLALLILNGCERRPEVVERAERVVDPEPVTELEQRIFDAVNEERRERGLTVVAWSDEVLPAAREHSQRMAQQGFFAHEDPELGNLDRRLPRHGVRPRVAGENLFVSKGAPDPVETAVEGWLESPGHRKVMLTDEFTHSAVGVARGENGTIFGTQIFIRP